LEGVQACETEFAQVGARSRESQKWSREEPELEPVLGGEPEPKLSRASRNWTESPIWDSYKVEIFWEQ